MANGSRSLRLRDAAELQLVLGMCAGSQCSKNAKIGRTEGFSVFGTPNPHPRREDRYTHPQTAKYPSVGYLPP